MDDALRCRPVPKAKELDPTISFLGDLVYDSRFSVAASFRRSIIEPLSEIADLCELGGVEIMRGFGL